MQRSNSRLLVKPSELWYNMITTSKGGDYMETKDIILELRTKQGLSQEALAEKVFVTRQAVSRWETGETIPNIDTLKLLSKLFDVSINTLLGSPRELVCQCCGMPLEDCTTSRETDGNFNEEYCKWCYADGEYTLDVWQRYVDLGGKEKFQEFKMQLVGELNQLLQIEGLPKVENLNVLPGEFVNLEYILPGGQKAKLFLLKMSLAEANVLILDEPTRNFSPLSGPEVRGILRQFPGTIISVSHDRKYISEVCNKIYTMTASGLKLSE